MTLLDRFRERLVELENMIADGKEQPDTRDKIEAVRILLGLPRVDRRKRYTSAPQTLNDFDKPGAEWGNA